MCVYYPSEQSGDHTSTSYSTFTVREPHWHYFFYDWTLIPSCPCPGLSPPTPCKVHGLLPYLRLTEVQALKPSGLNLLSNIRFLPITPFLNYFWLHVQVLPCSIPQPQGLSPWKSRHVIMQTICCPTTAPQCLPIRTST